MRNEIANITELPFFIIFKIASYLRDTDSYHNFRLSCKSIRDSLPYIRSFYESGAIHSSVKIYRGITKGNKEIFYESGELKSSYALRNFKYHGLYKEFYESGKKKIEGRYYLNKKDGCYFEYYKNGLMSISEQYFRGRREGSVFLYYDNGALKQEINFMNGQRNGVSKQYLKNGELIVEKSYKHDKLHGLYKEWNNGVLTILGCYMYGKLENEWDEFFPNGSRKLKKNYLDGKQHGNEIIHYMNGNIKTIKRFVLGKQQGVEKSFYRNGTIKYIEKWKDGAKHSISKYYTKENVSKIVDYFYNSIIYSCVHDKFNKKKIETFYTSVGKIQLQNYSNLYTLSIYSGNFTFENEVIYDHETTYTRILFSEILPLSKERSVELMTYEDIQNPCKSKTLTLNNRIKIRKSINVSSGSKVYIYVLTP